MMSLLGVLRAPAINNGGIFQGLVELFKLIGKVLN